MASTTAKIKKECLDESYSNNDVTPSVVTYARYGTPMTSSPTGVDSTTTPSSEGNHPPHAKRPRYEDGNEKIASQRKGPIYEAKLVKEKLLRIYRISKELHNGHSSRALCLSTAYEHYEGPHASATLKGLNERRIREQFVDLVLVVDGREIPCHKVVLCSASEYFSELLPPTSTTRYQQKLHINETSAEIMTQLVDFAYTSRIKITDYNIDQLLSAATVFQFNTIKEACIMVLKQRLAPSNCIAIKRFATKQACKDLIETAIKFTEDNFADMSASEDFVDLSLKELLSFVSSKNLNVKREEAVYEAVMQWIRHDLNSRKHCLPRILEHVRLPLVKPQFLLDVVQSEPLIKNNKECESYLDEARRFQLLVDQRPLMQTCRTQPRLAYSLKKTEILVTVGGLNKDKVPVHDCVYFNSPQPCAHHLSPLTVNQTAYSVASVNNNIFVSGGAFHTAYKEVWMYIPSLNKWQQVAPMNEARYLHASVGFGGYLYVVGGVGSSGRLRSVEKYNPDSNTWHNSEPMLRDLSSPTIATCDGFIYVIGGTTGSSSNDIVCDVQCYNPKNDTWKLVAPLPGPERGALAANLNGTIYLMGQHKSVFAYNRKGNKWIKLRNTNGGHLHGAATIHKGQLYVAGGLHGNSYINGTVEMYDYLNDSWHVTSTLHVPVYAQGFVSIFKDGVTASED